MAKKEKWICSKCKVSPEELWFFTGYGNHPKKKDEKPYCKKCFDKMWEGYGPKKKAS